MEKISPDNKEELYRDDSHVQIIAEGSPGRRLNSDLEFVAEDADVCMSQDSESDSGGRKRKVQRYRPQWEHHPSLKGWVAAVPGNQFRAWCTRCCCHLVAQLKVLLDHSLCRKHIRRMASLSPAQGSSLHPPLSSLSAPPVGSEVSAAETPEERAASGAPGPLAPVVWCRPVQDRSQQPDAQLSEGHRVTLSTGLGQMSVGFIGAGKMAQAVAMGLMNKGVVTAGRMSVSSATMKNTDIWKCWKCNLAADNADLVRCCDLVFLAVPPEDLAEALGSLESAGDMRLRCVVSLVSGVTHARLTELLQERLAVESMSVVRCVCTRTVAIGEGICVYYAPSLPPSWLLSLEIVFSALGMSQRARQERLLDVYSGAFSGGVAFSAQFIDALAAGAASQGVSWEEAVQMSAQTVQGAASMVLSQGTMPSELKRECCTPGGGTISGVMTLHRAGLDFAVMSAVEAATKKCHEAGAAL